MIFSPILSALFNRRQLFQASNLSIMPFWLMMIFLPRWKRTQQIMNSPMIALPPAIIYTAQIIDAMEKEGGRMDFQQLANPSPEGIAAMMSDPQTAAAGWSHYLAFDLLVGRWIYLDALDRNINPFLVAPALFFTLMLGPVGFLIYMTTRSVIERTR